MQGARIANFAQGAGRDIPCRVLQIAQQIAKWINRRFTHFGEFLYGLFVQFTVDSPVDAPIPDEAGSSGSSISFGVLKAAQALGDYKALQEAGRDVIQIHLGQDGAGGLERLVRELS